MVLLTKIVEIQVRIDLTVMHIKQSIFLKAE